MSRDDGKNIIWCSDEIDEIREEIEEEQQEDRTVMSDSEIEEEAYDRLGYRWDDEMANLDKNVKNNLIAIATLERWDGPHSAYLNLETKNIAKAIEKVNSSFGGDNNIQVYVDDENLVFSQTGHDNPVNPSIVKIRMFKDFDNFEDFLEKNDDSPESLEMGTESVVSVVNKIYGW